MLFIREGDARDFQFLMLLLDGEVTVEASRAEPIVITLLDGGLIGELWHVRWPAPLRKLHRRDQIALRDPDARNPEPPMENPEIAAKLLLAVSLRIGTRHARGDRQLKDVCVTQAMEQGIGCF
jgi:hypothetical protein